MACPLVQPRPDEAEPKLHVVDVLRRGIDGWLSSHRPTPQQIRLTGDLRRCRTAALGGHLHVCPECGYQSPVYNSCRNRHCPGCQALAQARWIRAREQVLLPVGHHHVVFTLPSQLRVLARAFPEPIYDVVFAAVRDTLALLAKDTFHAVLGITTVLHTWNRDVLHHPHVHCIVTAGGLTLDRRSWVQRHDFLFPAARMKAVFRAKLLAGLNRLRRRGQLPLPLPEWTAILKRLPPKDKWVVYTEAPFGRSAHVLAYLGRYTHRVAISDSRLLHADEDYVRFRTRDEKVLLLTVANFTARFMLHVLPRRFHKIRHFGLYAPGNARQALSDARVLIGQGDADLPDPPLTPTSPDPAPTWDRLLETLTGRDPLRCPHCGLARMTRTAFTKPTTPPRPSRPQAVRAPPRSPT